MTEVETMVQKAITLMKEELARKRGDRILSAKATETACKLLAQLCITGLMKEHRWSKKELARQLSDIGPHVDSGMINRWLTAKTTPEAVRLGVLLKLYMNTKGYLGGRAATEPRAEGKGGKERAKPPSK